jgi:hypothetical protein
MSTNLAEKSERGPVARPLQRQDEPTPPAATEGLRIVHPEFGYGRVHLLQPSDRGYIYVAASVRPGAGPIVLPSGRREKLADRVKQLASELELEPDVIHANTFRAIALPPTARFSHFLEAQGPARPLANFDLLVLVQATSVTAARAVCASQRMEELHRTLRTDTNHVQVTVAHNAKRLDDVRIDREGLFLFNHFVADDAAVMLDLWDYLAAWYVAETGLQNSIALVPETDQQSRFALVNWARWETNLLHHFWTQLSKRSFWRYVTANLDANRAASMPVYCRLA